MTRLKMFLATLLLLVATATTTPAQDSLTAYSLAFNWDVDSDSLTYPLITGQNGAVGGNPIIGLAPIATSGSSATVTAVTAGSLPFASVGVGDVIFSNLLSFVVIAKASGDSITVDPAVDLGTNSVFSWLKFTTGTAATSGWVDVGSFERTQVCVQYEQGDLATSLDFRLECRSGGVGAEEVLSGVLTALTTANAGLIAGRACITTTDPWGACRVGVQRNGADTSDAAANLERVVVSMSGRLRR